jgi:uncharacterized membrane protein
MVSSKETALTASFAALYAIFSLLPGLPIIGLPTLTIQLEAAMASVFGIILGPYLGALAALLGAILAWLLPPGSGSPFGMPFLFNPAINAFIVGLVYTGQWKKGFAVMAAVIAAFIFLPPSQPIIQYYYVAALVIWDKVIALLMIFPTIYLMKKYELSHVWSFVFYFFLAFIGNQADSALGCVIFAIPIVYNGIFGLTIDTVRYLFVVSPLVYPIIRLFQAIFAAIIAMSLVEALKNLGWPLPRS